VHHFCFHDGQIVVLHGFIKKTEATPKSDLALSRARLGLLKKG
jgi:phage-related protein